MLAYLATELAETLVTFRYNVRRNNAQKSKSNSSEPVIKLTDSLFHGLKWRNIGPFRGGRSVTSTGVIGQPHTYYIGSTGGGVFKTTDDGIT